MNSTKAFPISIALLLFVFAGFIGVEAQTVSPDKKAFDEAINKLSQQDASDAQCKEAVATIQRLATKGFGEALNEMGAFYAMGNNPEITQDYEKALRYFTRAWNAKELKAARNISLLYVNGYGVPKDTIKAYEWIQKGANAGAPDCMRDMGLFCLEPQLGMEVDSISTLGWFRKAAAKGDGESMWQLSRFYHLKGNAEESRYWLKKGAETENVYCMHGYGLYLKDGKSGVQQDEAEAARYFKKAADMYDFEESQMEYANLCDKKGDYTSAAKYHLMAAEKGNIWSMTVLADYNIAGKGGFTQNDNAAFVWYEKASNSQPRNREEVAWGIYCYTRLGLCYYLGKGVTMDKKKGRDILYQQAQEGNPVAQDYIKKLNIR